MKPSSSVKQATCSLPGLVSQCLLFLIAFFYPAVLLAQNFTPFPTPPIVDASGTTGSTGRSPRVGNGGNAGNGSPGTPISRELNTSVAGGGSTPVVSATSNGGAGGQGGKGQQDKYNPLDIYANGGDGGNGNVGGDVTVRLGAASGISSGSSAAALRLQTIGGAGGMSGDIDNKGTPGLAGKGGAGGALNLQQLPGGQIISTIAGVPAVLLNVSGGAGGKTVGTSTAFDNARGRSGGSGGDGGSIINNRGSPGLQGVIRSAGSGVVAISAGQRGAQTDY